MSDLVYQPQRTMVVRTTERRMKSMTVIRVDNLDQAHDADYTFTTLAHIVRADFYVAGHATNEG